MIYRNTTRDNFPYRYGDEFVKKNVWRRVKIENEVLLGAKRKGKIGEGRGGKYSEKKNMYEEKEKSEIFGEEKYFFSRRVFCRDKRFLRT